VVNKSVTTLIKSRIIITGKFRYFGIMLKIVLFFSFLLGGLISFSQVVDEIVQIDTTTEVIKVIYKPIENSTYYFKKVAVFADDTSQVAVEKSYNKLGQNGAYKVYYPNGRLKIKTVFANNKINGEWIWYDEARLILIKGNYKNGVKHGYWAYKSKKHFGKYKNGLKHKKWIEIDVNEQKHKTYFRNGKPSSGKIFETKKQEKEDVSKDIPTIKEDLIQVVEKVEIKGEYSQAIAFLKENVVFRKKAKKYFGGTIKKGQQIKQQFKDEKFSFVVSPTIVDLDINVFIKESEANNIEVAIIDSILKNKKEKLVSIFNGNINSDDNNLYENSTDKSSPIVVYFSNLNHNLLRIDVVKYDENIEKSNIIGAYKTSLKEQNYSILLYFNDNGELKGAEYEKY
jgi:hypothetical protein